MIKTYNGLAVKAMAAAVPRRIVHIRELATTFPDVDVERVIQTNGIEQVRLADEHTTSGDLCFAAAENLLNNIDLQRDEIDALLFLTLNPDPSIPLASHLLQHRLGLKNSTFCLDMLAGCSAFPVGLMQAALLLTQKTASNILLLIGDTPRKNLHRSDKPGHFAFGDAGSASLIQFSDGIDASVYSYADGEQIDGTGIEIFDFMRRSVPVAMSSLLDHVGLPRNDVDLFVFNQASQLMLKNLITSENLNPEKVLVSLKDVGNTGAASIPLTIVNDPGFRLRKRKNVVLCGYGAGLSCAAALTDFTQTKILPLIEV